MTHIYQKQGRYSGIIDFGEIRGTHALYDLSHFRVHDGEMLPILLFPYLLEGYYEMTALPHDYEQRIVLTSLLITIRTLARAMKRHPQSFQEHHALKVLKRDVQALLA